MGLVGLPAFGQPRLSSYRTGDIPPGTRGMGAACRSPMAETPSTSMLAKEASTEKQAGQQDAGIGHVGLRATDLEASVEFYRDVFGMEITNACAMDSVSCDPNVILRSRACHLSSCSHQ